jgi:hypothetical protein
MFCHLEWTSTHLCINWPFFPLIGAIYFILYMSPNQPPLVDELVYLNIYLFKLFFSNFWDVFIFPFLY